MLTPNLIMTPLLKCLVPHYVIITSDYFEAHFSFSKNYIPKLFLHVENLVNMPSHVAISKIHHAKESIYLTVFASSNEYQGVTCNFASLDFFFVSAHSYLFHYSNRNDLAGIKRGK